MVFENHRKPKAFGQTELPDRSVLIGQKLVEYDKVEKLRHVGWFSNTVYLRNEMWSFSLITISLFPRSTILQMYNHHSLFFVKVLARARVTHTLYRMHAILLQARPYVFFNLEQIFRRFFKSIPWTKEVDLISLRILIRARSQDRR